MFFLSPSPLDNILSNNLPLLGCAYALCCWLINLSIFMVCDPYSWSFNGDTFVGELKPGFIH